jgi:hypothetical protein
MSSIASYHPMRRALPERNPGARCGIAVLLVAVGAYVALSTLSTGDYVRGGAVSGDNPAPALDALVRGHLSAFASLQPVMGLTSLLIRAPVVWIAHLAHTSGLVEYRFGALACMLPVCMFAAWLVLRPGASRKQMLPAALAAVIIAAGPATISGVRVGHPEEILGSVLMTAAVLAALRGRENWAALLLGSAIGTKQWALLAAPCVLLALRERRTVAALKASAVAAVLAVSLPLAAPHAFTAASRAISGARYADVFSFWWWLGPQYPGARVDGAMSHLIPLGLTRTDAAALATALALGALCLYGWSRRRRGGTAIDPLALLALVGVIRCAADPAPLDYYWAVVLVPLATWETVARDRLPYVTALFGFSAWWILSFRAFEALSAPAICALSTACAAALGCYLVGMTFDVRMSGGLRSRFRLAADGAA